jgi:hypothetical protein
VTRRLPARSSTTGRFVSTANAPESREGSFETYTESPVDFQGADPGDLAYASEPRHAPSADALAQFDAPSRLRARRPEMVAAEDADHVVYGRQGAVLRTAARQAGLTGPIGHVLGLEPVTAPSAGVQRRDGSGARLPSMYQRPDVDQDAR